MGFGTQNISISGPLGNYATKAYVDLKAAVFPLLLYSGADYGQRLQAAINAVPAGSTITCYDTTGVPLTINTPVNITKPVTIYFGANAVVCNTGSATNVFNIQSNNVNLIGESRSPKKEQLTGQTSFTMLSGDYHIFCQGYNSMYIGQMDLIGIQSPVYTLTGSGGVFLIERNPYASGGGNNINQVLIDSLFVYGTKAHAVLILGGILSEIRNTRTSNAGGHGFYLGASSTSIQLIQCYASSSNLGGIVFDGASYSNALNCAAEASGVAFWLKSGANVQLIGCGAESNLTQTNTGSVPNLGIQVTTLDAPITTTTIPDIGSDFQTNFFKGHSLAITGGRNLYVPVFFSTDPGQAGSVGASVFTRHILIKGLTREAYIVNPRCTKSGSNTGTPRFDIGIETLSTDVPRDINLFFNPSQDGTVTPTITGKYITQTNSAGESTVVLDQGSSTIITSGADRWTYTSIRRTTVADADHTTGVSDDEIVLTSITAPRTETLLTPPSGENVRYRFKDESFAVSSTNTWTFVAQGGKTINGLSSIVITDPGWSGEIYYNGTNWMVQNSSSLYLKIFAFQNTDSTITGTLTQTILCNLKIPANSLGVNDNLKYEALLYKIGTAGTADFKAYLGPNSNSLTGALAVGLITLTATQLETGLERTIANKNSQTTNNVFAANLSQTTDKISNTTARTARNIDFTVDQYFMIACTLANTGDTGGIDNVQLYLRKV